MKPGRPDGRSRNSRLDRAGAAIVVAATLALSVAFGPAFDAAIDPEATRGDRTIVSTGAMEAPPKTILQTD